MGVSIMKDTGMIRKVDELGRIVLPIEMRRVLNINEKDALDISRDGDAIILRKYVPFCIFCGSEEMVTEFKGKTICKNCLDELINDR